MGEHMAHINGVAGPSQTVYDHGLNVGRQSGLFLECVGLGAVGRLAGELHDVGKLRQIFDDYLKNGGCRGSVIHTFQAVRYALDTWHRDADSESRVLSELLAFACGAHHGLFDLAGPDGLDGFGHRLSHPDTGYAEVVSNLCEERYAELYREALDEFRPVFNRIMELAMAQPDPALRTGEAMFYFGLLGRVILSALVDADRRDTASFMSGRKYPEWQDRGGLDAMWSRGLASLGSYLAGKPSDGAINMARRAISDACFAAAGAGQGVYTLHVGTGGGKTLSGLRFAMEHARRHGMRRAVFAMPKLTIIDQNAAEIRRALSGSDVGVLECHSDAGFDDGNSGIPYQLQLAMSEGWDAPAVVTTLAQFMDNLFSGRMDAIRRLHAMCGSTVLIDEVQDVPDDQLTLFSLAVNFLASVGRSTVVLCSATQPALRDIRHGLRVPVSRIDTGAEAYASVFDRVDYRFSWPLETLDAAGVASRAGELLAGHGSVLAVCNKKSQAAAVFREAKALGLPARHLSASMCWKHRWRVLRKILEDLEARRPVVCVATQVIEAGVDVSFGAGIRILAGLDSIGQTAGRIDRHGDMPVRGVLHIIRYKDEDLKFLRDIREGQDAAVSLLAEYVRDPSKFGGRLDSDEAVEYYYRTLYRNQGQKHDCLLDDGRLVSIYELLSENRGLCPGDGAVGTALAGRLQFLRHAPKTAAEHYSVYGNSGRSVIMAWSRGAGIVSELAGLDPVRDAGRIGELSREARAYTVSLFPWQLKELENELVALPGGMLGLYGHYDDDLGFVMDGGRMESLIR